jgi:hypothetical protein
MMRNATLQGAYLMLTEMLFPRNPRLSFDEACRIV